MNILFVHEVDWIGKVVLDFHSLSEILSLREHRVYAIDYESMWRKNGLFDFGHLRTREFPGTSRAVAGSSVALRRPGFVKVPGLSRMTAALAHYQEIKRTIKEEGIDVIVLYSVPTNGLQAVHLARKLNIPLVFRSIDILNQLVPHRMLRSVTSRMERKVYSSADMILTLTPTLSDYVIKNGGDRSRTYPLPMPVDTTLFRPSADPSHLRQKWGFDEEDEIVLFMGTLFEFSGLDSFIPEFSKIVQQVPNAKLLIVGDGPQRKKLDIIIGRLGLQRHITITGFQPYSTMPQYINLATLCINTFRLEGATRDIFPGKTVQFLACGKGLLATALPGMMAMIPDERHGVTYARSTDEMVMKTISLLRSTQQLQQLQRNGLEYVMSVHSHDRVAEQFEVRLAEAMDEKADSSRRIRDRAQSVEAR